MKSPSKTPLFLMEVIIMLLVFSASAAVCLQVFAEAKMMSEDSRNLDRACNEAQKAAEYWQGTQGDLSKTGALLETTVSGDHIVLFYDEQWQPTTEEPTFTLQLMAEETDANISVSHKEKEIFNLKTKAVMLSE